LLDERKEALFYAALELRCCVEARQGAYAEAQREYIRRRKIREWKIAEVRILLERVFDSGKIAQIIFENETKTLRYTSYYTPVTRHLANVAEQLGRYLHSLDRVRDDQDPWWERTRSHLIEVYRKAWIACRGDMLAPPIMAKDGIRHQVSFATDEDRELLLKIMMPKGSPFVAAVRYLEHPPDDWRPDL
jgi:hypothetical protein